MPISHHVLTIEPPDKARYQMRTDSISRALALCAPRLAQRADKTPRTNGEAAAAVFAR